MKRRISAEQLVDSLFTATGVPIYSEELTFDVPGWRAANAFTNLGVPARAWQFLPLTSDRDRPSRHPGNDASSIARRDRSEI